MSLMAESRAATMTRQSRTSRGLTRDRTAATPQLRAWTGGFGDAYVDRHPLTQRHLGPGTEAFRRMVGGLHLESVLEVGSNIGRNLRFIQALFGSRVKLYAVEPNRKAFDALVSQTPLQLEGAWDCDVFRLPLGDATIDVVFTAGVLIHIAPRDLGRATDEIVRVARKHVLCIEYFAHTPEEVPYRGRRALLFKRDFGAFYADRFPNLRCVDYGFLWKRELRIFDDLTWWLFEKSLDGRPRAQGNSRRVSWRS